MARRARGERPAARAIDPLALDQQLCFALYTASRAVTRAYAGLLESLGLTYPQYLVMLALWDGDAADVKCSVKHIGERLALDSGTLTPLLKRLEAAGLVARERDADDERVVTIHLTREGRELRAKARAIPRKLGCAMGVEDEAGVAEIVALRDRLQTLARHLLGDEAPSGWVDPEG